MKFGKMKTECGRREIYDHYLEQAREEIKDSDVPKDHDGMLYWKYRSIYLGCKNNKYEVKALSDSSIGSLFFSERDGLRIAARYEAMCDILRARECRCRLIG